MITWLNREKYFIFFVTALNLTVVAEKFFLYSKRNAEHIFVSCLLEALFVLACTVLVAFLVDCLLRKTIINRIFKAVFLLISIVMFFADIFTLYFYECRIDKAMLYVILGTNFSEAGEFISSYVTQPGFVILVVITLLCVFAACYLFSKLSLSNSKIFAIGLLFITLISGAIGIHEKLIVRDYLSPFRLFSMLWGVHKENIAMEEKMGK